MSTENLTTPFDRVYPTLNGAFLFEKLLINWRNQHYHSSQNQPTYSNERIKLISIIFWEEKGKHPIFNTKIGEYS